MGCQESKQSDLTDEDFVIPEAAKARLNKQRGSVSSESIAPGQSTFKKVVIPKDDAAKAMVRGICDQNILLKNLEEDQKTDIVNAARELRIMEDTDIIVQGDQVADDFYMLAEGTAEAFVNDVKVCSYVVGGCFGELALMYNAPRAATVKATSDCLLYALDRDTFRHLVVESNAARRAEYEKFLHECPILSTLDQQGLVAIADAAEPKTYPAGSNIITEGEEGHTFFLLLEGEVVATTSKSESFQKPYKRGDYFGELALLKDDDVTRKATCKATLDSKVLLLDRETFKRLLGPLKNILKENAELYNKYVELH